MLKKIKLDTVFCGIFILLSAFIVFQATKLKYWSRQYAPGPGFIPLWVGGLLLVLSTIAFIQSFRGDGITLDRILPSERTSRINLYVCWGALVFFLVFVKPLGFTITSIVVLSAVLSRGTKPVRAVIVSVLVTLVCFVVFKLVLQVQIPVNIFGW